MIRAVRKITKFLNVRAIGDVFRTTRREDTLRQRRFWEHQIRDENDLMRHITDCDYITPLRTLSYR